MKRSFIIAVVLWICCFPAIALANWPEFRGPTGDGQAGDADLPVTINETQHVRWSTEIHDRGWSSPVVWGDQIWVTTATPKGHKMYAVCIDRSEGKIVHDLLLIENSKPDFCHPMNSYATPTPVIEEGRVYVHFGAYGTICLDSRSGKKIWQRTDLPCDHFRGPASSPIIAGSQLIVAFDGADVQYVVALDKKSGATSWKQDRDIKYGTNNGDLKKAYGTGKVIEVNGQPQLIYPSAMATIAYQPQTGKEIWGAYHGGMNASARPLYGLGLLFITNGMGRMVAVQPDGEGDVTRSHVVWNIRKSVAKKSSQLLVDDLLYMVSDDGIVSCLEPKTGRAVWQKRMGGEYAASPIHAGGKIYFFGRQGDILVIEPGREFKLLAHNKLGDGYMASPAVVDDTMILRSKTRVYCIGK